MNQLPTEAKFRYPWRKYQQRVLDELEEHLDDDHLHVVAPPGSGKTVLGLEVAMRLNKPTLILAPTIAIRNQWVQRFCELFLGESKRPEWISRNIKEQAFLTVTTYQALHAACTGLEPEIEEETQEESEDRQGKKRTTKDKTREVIKSLKAQGVQTIIVDEAHHLKNTWWKSLNAVKNGLDPTIVGLTATPPYDVSYAEWQRYLDLNGPVDAEISVPELIEEGDLCPHQDYLFLTSPTMEEFKRIRQHHDRIGKLVEELLRDQELINAIMGHFCFVNPKENLEWIYSNFEWYVATLIFLNAAGQKISPLHLKVVTGGEISIPDLTNDYLATLLTFYLFKDPKNFRNGEHQEKLLTKLKRCGAIERRAIVLNPSRKISKLLSSSIGKLEGIRKIVNFEYQQLKDSMRMVILTDYIRKEFLASGTENNLSLNKIGVLPIFESLRRNLMDELRIGVLSGSLVIVPVEALGAFQKAAASHGVKSVSWKHLSYDDRFAIINSSKNIKHVIVHIFTQIFESGAIQVIVGTKSLLGEGWDAPTINALILASFVGSHVLSNQMRGRAIRKDPGNDEKTGNIWHLACVDYTDSEGGDDVRLLKRRFKGFVGCSNKESVSIENGFGRLGFPEQFHSAADIEKTNNDTFIRAARRDLLKIQWREALSSGSVMIEELKVPFPDARGIKLLKRLYYYKTIRNFLITLGFSILGFSQQVLESLARNFRHIKEPQDLIKVLVILAFVVALFFGGKLFKAAKILIRFRDISKDLREIAEALLNSLIRTSSIRTSYSDLEVCSEVDDSGGIYCHLKGASTYEKSLFIKSLKEVIGQVDNPRYIIIRKSRSFMFIPQRDFHSVPEIIGRNKESAEYFARDWRRWVGNCRLIFTRTIEGRQFLLKARVDSLASQLEDDTEQVKVWR